MQSIYLKKSGLPDKPGVYFFLKNNKILYIGKATSLKDRTKSYFGKDLINTRGPLILDMVFKADEVRWETTDSVLEAIILEVNLIKKHQPYYNTKEKDDKSFNYVCITKEKLPKVVIVRGRELQNLTTSNFSPLRPSLSTKRDPRGQKIQSSSVFGPYTNGLQLKEAVKIIRRIFPFMDEKSKNYLEFYKQIDLVPDLKDTKMYLQNIKNIKLFFEGKKKKILKNLEKDMKAYAKNHEFEKAGEIKRQVFSLQHINDIALIKETSTSSNFSSYKIEAYDIAHMGGKNMVGVMTVVESGEVAKHEYKKFKIKTQTSSNDTGALKEVLERRLAHTEWAYPSLIAVDGGVAQLNVAQKVLKAMNLKIDVAAVVKDERHKPKAILGREALVGKHKRAILLANSEAHRFAIAYHKKTRNKNFLI